MFKEQIETLEPNWKDILLPIVNNFQTEKLTEILPPKHLIFNAFNKFNYVDLKVVILGQDPYYRKGQANGLCFSVNDNIKIPPSLKNIFKEMYNDLGIEFELPKSGNLEYLSEQGILLLNNTLTVEESKPNSHLKYWNGFSRKVIEHINDKSNNIIFILWGGNAKKIKKYITDNHHILESNHPSPLSANKGGWWGNKHFSKCNKILSNLGKTEITWIKK